MKNYPTLNSHFRVEWGGTRTSFLEISGLTIENDVVEYREGSSSEYDSQKMPGLKKPHFVVLKRTIVEGDNDFFLWINTVKYNKVERRDVTVSLLNEEHNPIMTWKIKNAWPAKLDSPVLKAEGSDVAIETLILAHEGITIET